MKCILTNKGMPNLEDGSSSKNSIITHTATTDPSIDHTPVREWLEYVRDGVAKFGSDLNGETKLREKMEAARFINIEEQVLRCPIGTWPKNRTLKLAGLYWRITISNGLMSVAKRPTENGLGWTVAEIEVFLVGVRKALHDSSFHSYMKVVIPRCQWILRYHSDRFPQATAYALRPKALRNHHGQQTMKHEVSDLW